MKYERPQVIEALRGVFKLFENGDVDRQAQAGDPPLKQQLRVTKVLLVVQEILEEEDKRGS